MSSFKNSEFEAKCNTSSDKSGLAMSLCHKHLGRLLFPTWTGVTGNSRSQFYKDLQGEERKVAAFGQFYVDLCFIGFPLTIQIQK